MTHFYQARRKKSDSHFPAQTGGHKRPRKSQWEAGKALLKNMWQVYAGTILFEMDGVEIAIAKEAMRLASQKLPVKCRFVTSK